jgi:2-polyprenyl-3-methyl-5-hydroxy-6-metoxy-1,4-benzoquinol methylase
MIMMPIVDTAKTVKPYSLIAPIYDCMMRHVEYPDWADYFEEIFNQSERPILDVCDIACGTGSLLIGLYQKGYILTGSDVSPEMIEIARKKSARLGIDIAWSAESMLQSRPSEMCDAVICTFDSINYLLSPDEWHECLSMVFTMLRPSGMFIFDVSTEKNSKDNFDQVFELDRLNRFKRISQYDKKTRIQINRIELVIQNQVFVEEHRQRIYRISEIMSMIGRTRFSLLGKYDHLSFVQGSEESERIHFVLKK